MSERPTLPEEQIAQLLEENQQLKDELKELKPLVFGSKKERFVPDPDNQLSFGLAEDPNQPSVPLK